MEGSPYLGVQSHLTMLLHYKGISIHRTERDFCRQIRLFMGANRPVVT